MKLIKLFFIFSLVLSVSGCDYLDVVPDERPTEKDAFKNKYAAENFLYSCYSYLPQPRSGTGSIDFMTADEVVTAFEHETFANFPKGNYTASNPVISYWNTLFKGIRQCYLMIDGVDATPDLDAEKKSLYKAEAKFLIAYYHWLLVRMYGPSIIVHGVIDPNTPMDKFPYRTSYDECISQIATMFDEAASQLPVQHKSLDYDYGRATKVAAKALKARMLLYAASPLFNGGGGEMPSLYDKFLNVDGTQMISTTYDANKWKIAADATLDAINEAEAAGFKLYVDKQTATITEPTDPIERNLRLTFMEMPSEEVIWADTRPEGAYDLHNKSTPFVEGYAWNGVAPTLQMVENFYTKNGLPIDEDPTYAYDSRYAVVDGPNGKTMSLNLNREPRFNAWIAYHNSYYEITRESGKKMLVQFRKNDAQGIKNRANNYSPTGYLNKKGVHPSYNQRSLASPSPKYAWPIVRLAELYLNYAEALIEGGSDFATAKQYIDRVRVRAGIPSVDDAWANAETPGANDKLTLRKIVRQERTNEFYLENMRFWDLRRWMIADKYLDVKAKGMNIQGATDEAFFQVTEVAFPRKFRADAFWLMPIPQGEINKNEHLVQNPGY